MVQQIRNQYMSKYLYSGVKDLCTVLQVLNLGISKCAKTQAQRKENKGYFQHYTKLAIYMLVLNVAEINLIAMKKFVSRNKILKKCHAVEHS
jgi:hypothetical protein